MDFNYVIVQAGGKGTRLEHLTENKPKALVPIGEKPMLFHLFDLFPKKKFIIIGDYHYDVLDRYLKVFSPVSYDLIDARGLRGTCAGLNDALNHIPHEKQFMLIWSDLILNPKFDVTTAQNGNYLGVSSGFECRWRYQSGIFEEIPSSETGVAGMFLFSDKKILSDVPNSGEFVRWLSSKNISFEPIPLDKTQEFGLLSEYKKQTVRKCRPFNSIVFQDDRIIKEGITLQGKELAEREIAWYRKATAENFKQIPSVYQESPLILKRIQGINVYEATNVPLEDKKSILTEIVTSLKNLHSLSHCELDEKSYWEAYLHKTFERLQKIQSLIPFAEEPLLMINGRKCCNVFFHKEKLKELLKEYIPKEFVFIHGDCTFSNIMFEDGTPVFIDPRGYFGSTDFFGDVAYDWSKLYYSIVGNYDQFNLKKFHLQLAEDEVTLQIDSNGWEMLEDFYFSLLADEGISKKQVQLMHALIWLSLTTYAWEDYDSICGAFYNGLYYLQEVFSYELSSSDESDR